MKVSSRFDCVKHWPAWQLGDYSGLKPVSKAPVVETNSEAAGTGDVRPPNDAAELFLPCVGCGKHADLGMGVGMWRFPYCSCCQRSSRANPMLPVVYWEAHRLGIDPRDVPITTYRAEKRGEAAATNGVRAPDEESAPDTELRKKLEALKARYQQHEQLAANTNTEIEKIKANLFANFVHHIQTLLATNQSHKSTGEEK